MRCHSQNAKETSVCCWPPTHTNSIHITLMAVQGCLVQFRQPQQCAIAALCFSFELCAQLKLCLATHDSQISPFQKVPALEDGDMTLVSSWEAFPQAQTPCIRDNETPIGCDFFILDSPFCVSGCLGVNKSFGVMIRCTIATFVGLRF